MKRILNTVVVFGALCAALGSCTKDEGGKTPGGPAYEQGFTGVSRADVNGTGNPAHADTYRMMAYLKTGTAIMTNASNSGTYAYDLNGDYAANPLVGSIVPVAVNSTTYQTTLAGGLLQKDGRYAMHLTAGDYYVSMIHPAVPIYGAGTLGNLAVFNRTDKVYTSLPLDKNGDGTADDPFEITVADNGQINDATGVVMHPLMSAIKVYFYSHFYAETDPGHTTPLSVNYTAEEIKLVNAGNNGWYNAKTDFVYPNYNYGSKTSYSMNLNPNGTANEEPQTVAASSATFTDRNGETVTAKYVIDNMPVMPADYRGADMGGNPYVIPMTLSVKLKDDNGLYNKASIPISIVIKRNKQYRFYINVTSEQIGIAYTVSAWDYDYDDTNYTDLGGDLVQYADIDIDWTPNGGWDNGGGGNQEIN